MGRAFSPRTIAWLLSWGVAPGWYISGLRPFFILWVSLTAKQLRNIEFRSVGRTSCTSAVQNSLFDILNFKYFWLALRARAKISLHSGASAGRADARRRDAGDVVHLRVATTQQMPRPPPRPAGLPALRIAIIYVSFLHE
jgi:hypothetical protein